MTDKQEETNQQQTQQTQQPLVPRAQNVHTAVFSSAAKIAESLVSGPNSVLFNTYNNYLVFKWIATQIDECAAIDIPNRLLINFNGITFSNGSAITGISDGYGYDRYGRLVHMYDPTVVLNTTFSYEIVNVVNNEITERRYDNRVFTNIIQNIGTAAEHAESLIHYLEFDFVDPAMQVVIPVEDEENGSEEFDPMPLSQTIDYGDTVEVPQRRKMRPVLNTQFDADGVHVVNSLDAPLLEAVVVEATNVNAEEVNAKFVIAEEVDANTVNAEETNSVTVNAMNVYASESVQTPLLASVIGSIEHIELGDSITFPQFIRGGQKNSSGELIISEVQPNIKAGERARVLNELEFSELNPSREYYMDYLALGGIKGKTSEMGTTRRE